MKSGAVFLAILIVISSVQLCLSDKLVLTGVVRDFWPCSEASSCGMNGVNVTCDPNKCMPDFEYRSGPAEKGIVLSTLGSDGKPVYNSAIPHATIRSNGTTWPYWFNNAAGWNIAMNINITLDNTVCASGSNCDPNVYGYDNGFFFPIDNQGFGNYYAGHNYAFCFELHTRFSYRGTEVFTFTGDDDVWVFMNNQLVVDLGGVHGQLSQTLVVNTTNIGLKPQHTYPFDLFFCERHTTASHFRMYTSIGLICSVDWCGVCNGDGQSCCNCTDNNACTTDRCNATTGACIFTNTTCPTPTDKCALASCSTTLGCVSTPVNCDDANACTIDNCDSDKGCQRIPRTCSDATVCTIDTCDPSQGCVFTPVSCDDNTVCTTDSCDAVNGCANSPITCNDNNSCTTDTCDAVKGCQFTSIICNDNSDCTTDTCDPNSGCKFIPKTCNDNSLCTTDTCNANGGCQYTSISCNDDSQCTTDSCNPSTGCVNMPVNCNDGQACTIDTCQIATGCQYSILNCDDGNKCTVDTCQNATGCIHSQMTCDDGNACTADSCDPNTGCINKATICNDMNACTLDTCDSKIGCVYQTRSCDDSNACTTDSCDSVTGCQYANVTCNDNNACTVDSCQPSSGCQFVTKSCDDSNPCTADSCNTTTGCFTTPVACNLCTSFEVVCSALDACHPSNCDPSTGKCTVNTINCNDENPCTDDSCQAINGSAICQHVPQVCNSTNSCFPSSCNNGVCVTKNITCDDSNPCTMDSCKGSGPTAVCKFTLNMCNQNDPCNPQSCLRANGTCITSPVICDDGNRCTNDNCQVVNGTATCVYIPAPCYSEDVCSPSTCNVATGNCQTNSVSCDDGNKCTFDYCRSNATTGQAECVFDRIPCANSTACAPLICQPSTGMCLAPVNPVCTDGNLCTNDTCSLSNGLANCSFPAVQCIPPNPCIIATCSSTNGSCLNTPVNCDDGNPCTNDYPVIVGNTCQCRHDQYLCPSVDACFPQMCNAGSGLCEIVPVVCDDGNACTSNKCNNGTCMFPLVSCDDGNACTTDTCDTIKGCQYVTATCDDRDSCTTDTCNVTSGCVYSDIAAPAVASCMLAYCDRYLGNVVAPKICRPSDTCHCDVATNQCVCDSNFFNDLPTAVKIGGGVIAGITLGALAFVGIVVFGGKKGYNYWVNRSNVGPDVKVEDNPLYEMQNKSTDNPLFENDSTV